MFGAPVAVRQCGERWLSGYVETRPSEKGRKLTVARFGQYLEPFMGHMMVERVNGEDERAYRLWLERNTKLSVTSVWHLLSDCRCLFNWCEAAISPRCSKSWVTLRSKPRSGTGGSRMRR